MTKIDIFSGFLGAGKTTLIKKLISEAYSGEKVVLIENEFGEIGIDGGFLKEAGIEITEMNSGCICCSLVGDFAEALKKVLDEYKPDRIIIEPSGVGKLSDVIRAVKGIEAEEAVLNAFTTVVDAKKCKVYMKNFGEFFCDQVEHASAIVLSHTAGMDEEKLHTCVHLLREHNENATIVTTDWEELTGAQILAATESKNTLAHHIHALEEEEVCPECGHHHHHHDHGEECTCGCHHDHEHHHHHHHDEAHEHHHHHDEAHEHHHHHDEAHEHHHHHDEAHEHHHHHDEAHEHHHHHDEAHKHHHHDHGEECTCGCHHDHDHHHHHADEVFTSFGRETAKKFTAEAIEKALRELENEENFGIILRAKGIVAGEDGNWIHFDYVPGEPDVRAGSADVTGRICVIGSKINEEAIAKLFGV